MDLSKEIRAYALQNAIEFGKTEAGKILPKLFQHGLDKANIKEVMPLIQKTVKEINSLSEKERTVEFEKSKSFVKEKVVEERALPELPEVSSKMVFRMAPFPSGALHIGNAKTALLNVLYAEKYKADLLLVMDDTIGSEEKQPLKESYGLIEEACELLGIQYKKPVIYKSDRLEIYYEYAEKLIRANQAYVCHCAQEVLRENRAQGIVCPCRELPWEEQFKRWNALFTAAEGSAVLRIKTSMSHPNPAFRDRVLFKISDRAHPRVKKRYRVWPSLEMSWAIDDHLLGITHILRGNDLTIETDMEKFIWDLFSWKHPVTLHSGLIKIEGAGAKVSKSKAQKEIKEGLFSGWDDPRTWSIQSLARRGIRKEAIRAFVEEIGLNRQDITVPIESLYALNRKLIDAEALRYYFVRDPVEITISGLVPKSVEIPVHPDRTEVRTVSVSSSVYVSKEDFASHKGQETRLLHLGNVILDKKAKFTSLENKKLARIQWVSGSIPIRILMVDGTWVEGHGEKALGKVKKGAMVQFERFGFARFDRKTKEGYEFWFAHQ